MDDLEPQKSPKEEKPSNEVLQDLMEKLGEEVDVLKQIKKIATTLEGELDTKHLNLAKGLVVMVIIATAFNVIALLWSESNIASIRSAQKTIESTAREGKIFAKENRKIINDLKTVADKAQEQGAKTSVELCTELNAVKAPIRRLLGLSSRGKQYQVLFKDKKCSNLPNATPVTP